MGSSLGSGPVPVCLPLRPTGLAACPCGCWSPQVCLYARLARACPRPVWPSGAHRCEVLVAEHGAVVAVAHMSPGAPPATRAALGELVAAARRTFEAEVSAAPSISERLARIGARNARLAGDVDEPVAGEVGWHVPDGATRCPRCGDQNWEEQTRLCITCTHGDDGYQGGRFRNGWSARVAVDVGPGA